jgi:hypothetical protein
VGKGTFSLVMGCDPPTALFFVQIYGPRSALLEGQLPIDDEPGGDPHDQVLLLDQDMATLDELEQVMREQPYLTFAEACEAFGQPFEREDGPWLNDYGRKKLEAEQREFRGEPPPVAARELAEQIMPGRLTPEPVPPTEEA